MPKRVTRSNANRSLPGPSSTPGSSPSLSDTSEEENGVPDSTSLKSPSRSSPRITKKSKSMTQPSKKSKQSKTQIPMTPNRKKRHEAEINRLVHDCIYYMLVVDQKKYPIKRADIIKNVVKDHRREFNTIILKVRDILKQTFGVKMIELDDKKGTYFLVNYDMDIKIGEFSEKDTSFRGLLLFILTVIWMKEGAVPEEELWRVLKLLEVDPEDKKPHPVFGDVRKYVTQELPKQLYLTYGKVNSDPPLFEFGWGPRANYEVDKEEMLNFVCEVYKNDPKDWIVQHQDVLRSKQ